MIRYPELALRGFDLCQQHSDVWGPGEAYVRRDVHTRASAALSRDNLAADPVAALTVALAASDNLLSPYERSKSTAWAKHNKADSVGNILSDFLLGAGPLAERAGRFLEATREAPLEGGKRMGVNPTVATYLLCMSDSARYAFGKPDTALHPAWSLLVSADGSNAPTGAERIVAVTDFYVELRALFARERTFEGDLLDVHTILFALGGSYAPQGISWAVAVDPRDIAAFVCETRADWPSVELVQRAAALVYEVGFDRARPDDPLHDMQVEQYAYGMTRERRSLAWVAEQGTRELSGLGLGNAGAYKVGRISEGNWRFGMRDEGHSREEAQAKFERDVLPELRELAIYARALVSGSELPEPVAIPVWRKRALDIKFLHLFAAAFDAEWTYRNFVSVNNPILLADIARLLKAGGAGPWKFRDLLDCIRGIAAQLDTTQPRPPAHVVQLWLLNDPRGKHLMRLLRGKSPVDPEQTGEPMTDGAGITGGIDKEPLPESGWAWFLDSIEDVDLRELARRLKQRSNVLLYGPPGTGKTWMANVLARHWRRWMGDDGTIVQVTFHPSYGYEEFVEGFRPAPDAPSEFRLTPGVLTRFAERAQQESDRNFLLLIDEINRGDVARIFGELITLVEADKRSREHARLRMLSGIPLWLPPNLYLLGTMNTADKSVSLLDVAIRRRFAFFHLGPRPDLLDDPGLVAVGGLRLSRVLAALNQRLLAIGVLPEKHIGHSFLWIPNTVDDPMEAIADRLRLDVIPLVEEYCFAQRDRMRAVLGELVDEYGRPHEESLKPERLLQVLATWVP